MNAVRSKPIKARVQRFSVSSMWEALNEKTIQRTIVTELKTVDELLLELGFSTIHVVLIDGKRVPSQMGFRTITMSQFSR